MKIFYDEKGKNGNYFELQDVKDFPKMKKIIGVFGYISSQKKINFNYSLENVIDGSYAFYQSQILESFNSNLSKLENGEDMFYGCENLITFSSNLSSLTYGYRMFDACDKLTSFFSELPSLANGDYMFRDCSNLTSFLSDLGSLKGGHQMFEGCKLDINSLRNIADTINDITDLDENNNNDWKYEVLGKTKTISSTSRGHIDICHADSISEEVIIECGNKLIDKGWTVYFNNTLYEYTNQ